MNSPAVIKWCAISIGRVMAPEFFENENVTDNSSWKCLFIMRSRASGCCEETKRFCRALLFHTIQTNLLPFWTTRVQETGLGPVDRLLGHHAFPIWLLAISFMGSYQIKDKFHTWRFHRWAENKKGENTSNQSREFNSCFGICEFVSIFYDESSQWLYLKHYGLLKSLFVIHSFIVIEFHWIFKY